MILKRFYNEPLAQASYLVGCAKTGEAIVIDANRDVDQYLEAAASEGLRIVAVTETHIHADYVSGSRELAARAGARLYLSDEGDADWKYAFANESNVVLIRDGDSISVGNLRLDVLQTPGHTPEHVSFVLYDLPASAEPMGVFTGDFVFVGDVGRPDLLERAAGYEGTMEKGARVLYDSLSRFRRALPGFVTLWPAHGAGSACGKSLGGVPVSTLGYEEQANWAFRLSTEESFVNAVLAGQPEPPVYFKEMKRINKMGPAFVSDLPVPARLGGEGLLERLGENVTVVDVRPAGVAALGLVPQAVNIPTGKSFATWAGWLIPYDRPIYLIAEHEDQAMEAVRDLRLIGLDDVRGWYGADALRAYERARGPLDVAPQIAVSELNGTTVLDVRGATEFEAGHVPGALHVPLGYLRTRLDEIPRDRPLAVMCAGGGRSPIAVSLLRGLGFKNAANVPGGYADYAASRTQAGADMLAEPATR
jgi:hydroxyacylglutathione hydrolase